MNRTAISDAASWAGSFIKAEWRLLLPVALAFFALPQLAVQVFAADALTLAEAQRGSPAMLLWFLPMMLGNIVGGIALSALAIVPRITVGDAIGRGIRRLPTLFVACVILVAVLAAVIFAGMIVFGVAAAGLGLGRAGIVTLLSAFVSIVGIICVVRLTFLFPALADHESTALAALKETWRLTRPVFWQLLGLFLLLLVVSGIIGLAIQASLGSVLLLLGKMLGGEAVARALILIITTAIGAAFSGGFYVLSAAIYAQRRGAT
ncbi:hypothetical protein [Sphingomonas sp. ID0503]|uniref:hypothetical protein n=1 Tax=Sphingomonas sp. ID0503 TaxID=3399691 RepID=UPI003AFA3CA1